MIPEVRKALSRFLRLPIENIQAPVFFLISFGLSFFLSSEGLFAQIATTRHSSGIASPNLIHEVGEGYDFRLELGMEHSDNRARRDPRGPSDTLLIPRLDLAAFRNGDRLNLSTKGQIEFRHSLPDRFEDELRANVQASLGWQLLPNRLTWDFADVASVEPVDVLEVDRPDNLQQTNVFATGPELSLISRGPLRSSVRARFATSQAEDTDEFNTNRTSVSARVRRTLRPSRHLTLQIDGSDVRVRDNRFQESDHRRADALARFATRGDSISLDLIGGYTWTDFDIGKSPSEPSGRIQLGWELDQSLRLRLAASHQLSDGIRELLNSLENLNDEPFTRASEDTRRLRTNAEIFTLDNFELSLGYSGSRLNLSINTFYRDYKFGRGNQDLNFSGNGTFVTLSQRINEATTAGVTLTIERRRFEIESRRDTDFRAFLFLEQRLNSRFAIRTSFARNQRWSNISGAESRENIAGVALIYFGGRS